jgi:hypothetical protein
MATPTNAENMDIGSRKSKHQSNTNIENAVKSAEIHL